MHSCCSVDYKTTFLARHFCMCYMPRFSLSLYFLSLTYLFTERCGIIRIGHIYVFIYVMFTCLQDSIQRFANVLLRSLTYVPLALLSLQDFPLLVFILFIDGLSIIHEALIVCLLNGLFW